MRILIDGKLYDSTETPVLIIFDENEQEMFNGMKRFVSAPEKSTIEDRQKLLDVMICNMENATHVYSKVDVNDDLGVYCLKGRFYEIVSIDVEEKLAVIICEEQYDGVDEIQISFDDKDFIFLALVGEE